MIIKTELIKPACSTILLAVDSNDLSAITETLELKAVGNNLQLNVTNREYYARVNLDLEEPETFKATVNANLFLKLISQTTSEFINLSVNDKTLIVKGNGTYKLPLIYDGENLLDLPEININNSTATFDIDSDILSSILTFNTKGLCQGITGKLVQKLYYVDENGCITFAKGACVNNFTLPQPIKVLLTPRLVKLFKLFKGDKVKFTLGYDSITNDIIQTKVKFETPNIELTSILSCDDTLLNSVPVKPIRDRAMNTYPHSVVLSKDALLQTLNRMMLFTNLKENVYGVFKFDKDALTISFKGEDTTETIAYANQSNVTEKYEATLDLVDLKSTLEGCTEQFININFGDGQAFVVARGNIYNVIPEVISE